MTQKKVERLCDPPIQKEGGGVQILPFHYWLPYVKYLSQKIEGVHRRAGKLPAILKKYHIMTVFNVTILHNIDIIENEVNCLVFGKSKMLELQNYSKTRGY